MGPTAFPFADLALARRLEAVEGQANANFVDARARLAPESGACRIEVAGGQAMFDGPESPMTQTFGLGLSGPVTPADLTAIETFFNQRQAPTFHEVSPLADGGLLPLLHARGYEPIEFTSVMFRPVEPDDVAANGVGARLICPGEEGIWARTAASGWAEFGLADFMLDMSRVMAQAEGARLFLAELDGQPIATAALNIHDGVAHFAGASTVPEWRGRGAQRALLDRRMREAADQGCDLAAMGARPGSGSQRNAERQGFRIAYTRVKWRR